jgi:catechol 2,3-dioxygenase-like lactoylglutathione lyase family enzyme
MSITALYAQLNCTDLEQSSAWFSRLFGRKPDAAPMNGLLEWHHQQCAGFQLFQFPEYAGKGTVTLIVEDIGLARLRIRDAGLQPGKIEDADYTTICRLYDPDGNLVVLAQPKSIPPPSLQPYEATDT